MNLIFPCSALTGTEEPEDPSWLIRIWRRPGGFPGQRCPQDGEKPAESPLRAVRPLRAATAHSGAQAGTAPSSHSSCSGRTAVAQPRPSAACLTEPQPRSPHGSPPASAILNRPRPPATSLHFTIAFFFSRGGGLSPLAFPYTTCSAPVSFFFLIIIVVIAIVWDFFFFTFINTHCSKISPPPPSPSGSRQRSFNSHFPNTGRIINLERDSPRSLRDHLGQK